MTAIIVIFTFLGLASLVFALALCKASRLADDSVEEIYRQELKRRRDRLIRKWERGQPGRGKE